MGNGAKVLVIIVALATLIFAIKPYYGGDITIRLNEPTNFAYTPSDYSNLVFYSLLYENLFYLKNNGEIFSNVFSSYKYDQANLQVILELHEGLSFSSGDPVTPERVQASIRQFLELKLDTSATLGRMIKRIDVSGNRVVIHLMYHRPDILSLFSAPELVLLPGTQGVFSGMFYPVEWEKDKFIKLAPNQYYPGGRSYLDSVKVVFYDYYYPDMFLSGPGLQEKGFREYKAGVYQNIYLVFPHGKVGNNIRVALYSLLRSFAETVDMKPLNSLTSDEESPVTLNIRKFSHRRVRSILRYTRAKLYILSSLKNLEEKFSQFLSKRGIRLETIYVTENALNSFINDSAVKYMMVVKVFNKRMPLAEKVRKVVKELSFSRFSEDYLNLINQMEEVEALKNEELLMDQAAKLVEKVINDGFLLPLFQKRFSFYIKDRVQGIEVDYYGRPLFRHMRLDRRMLPVKPAPPTPVEGAETGQQ